MNLKTLEKLLPFIILFLLTQSALLAQPCFPFGKTLSSQKEIDDFFTDYPGCTVIEGPLVIDDLDDGTVDIQNLEGLNGITELQSNLEFFGCWLLSDFSGMNQVRRIDGSLDVQSNKQPVNFNGFDQLDTIGGGLVIGNNENLRSLEGFSRLRHIGGVLSIGGNKQLSLDAGLDSLRSAGALNISNSTAGTLAMFRALERIEDYLRIGNNASLKTISGFDQLTFIGEELEFYDNDSLAIIQGFDQLTEIGQFFQIINSPRLSEIGPFGQLNKIRGDVYLYNNPMLSGFHSEFSSLDTIGGMLFLDFNSSLKRLTFPSLKYIGKDLAIYYHDSLDILDGFPVLEEIGGPLIISNNPMISSISGFNQVKRIGGQFKIDQNFSLAEFSGFQQLQSINGTFWFSNNSLVTGMDNLGNLESLAGSLIIQDNAQLSSISGLSGIDPETITLGSEVGVYQELVIYKNPLLDHCAIQSICDYFGQDETDAYINDNGGPCDSEWAILNACTVKTSQWTGNTVYVYPVPASDRLQIDLQGTGTPLLRTEILDLNGRLCKHMVPGDQDRVMTMDISDIPAGMYLLKIIFDRHSVTEKLVISR
jgi:hypothetical protein